MTVAASPRPVLGVDACPCGWVGVSLRDGRFAGAQVGSSLQGLAAAAGAAVVGIDMPLGLVDSGWREADFAVRTLLGRRSSSVFVMPPRRVFEESDQAAASAVCKAMTGKGISVQAWGLKPKLLEANRVYDAGALVLREVHPELSFIALGLGAEDGSKKTWRGQRARLRVLAAAGIVVPEDLGAAVATVPADDVLDATAVAWTAHRIACGQAVCVPDPPQINERGQQLAIWY